MLIDERLCARVGDHLLSIRVCRTRKTTTLARLVNAQKCVASSKDSACDFGRNQQRKALYSASFDSSPKSLFSLKQRSSRKILERMEFNLSTRQNMGRFRRWNYMTGSFYGLTGGRGVGVPYVSQVYYFVLPMHDFHLRRGRSNTLLWMQSHWWSWLSWIDTRAELFEGGLR